MLQVNHQQNQHYINVSEHTIYTVNKIHTNKYIEHDPNKPILTSMREKRTDKFENAHIQTVAIEFSRRRGQESSTSRVFFELIVLDYKRARQSRQRVSSNSISLV